MAEDNSNMTYISYNHMHKLCQQSATKLREANKMPDIIVAISGGGLIPARMLRTFLKKENGGKNVPIQAIGLSLYEDLSTSEFKQVIGKEVVKTQWLDLNIINEKFGSLLGKKILIVDEVDDTRTTLAYALEELEKEVKLAKKQECSEIETEFSVFVLYNKMKPKKKELPDYIMNQGRYIVASEVSDSWLCFPYDSIDIDLHTKKATEQGNI
ncbi:hypothetical protein QEN19_001612 [Hanseniaspora menglaensis]